MSLRITGNKLSLRRTTALPTSFAAFTIIMYTKLAVARPTHNAHLLYAQTPGGSIAQALQLRGVSGTELRAADNYESTLSASAGTLPAGLASGQGWFGTALRGTAAGAGGMQALHKPVGTGSLSVQAVANTAGASAWDSLQVGDAPFAPGEFGVAAWWTDCFIAHLKIYNRALSDAEVTAEMNQAAPASTTGLLSYHSFAAAAIGDALAPQQGSGTFSVFTSAPSMSPDMPVFSAVPTLTLTDNLPPPEGASSALSVALNGATNITFSSFTLNATVSGAIPAGAVTRFQWTADFAVAWQESELMATTAGAISQTFTGAPASSTIYWRVFVAVAGVVQQMTSEASFNTLAAEVPGGPGPGQGTPPLTLVNGTPTNITTTGFTLSATVSGTIPAGAVTRIQWTTNPVTGWEESETQPAVAGTFSHTFTGAPSGTVITWRAFVITPPATVLRQTPNTTFNTLAAPGGGGTPPPGGGTGLTYYFDPTSTGGSGALGSITNPYRTQSDLTTIPRGPDVTLLFRRGTTWRPGLHGTNGSFNAPLFPRNFPTANNVRIGAYGEGAKPIIDGSIDLGGWTLVPGYSDVYVATMPLTVYPPPPPGELPTYPHDRAGNLTQGTNTPIFARWEGSVAATLALHYVVGQPFVQFYHYTSMYTGVWYLRTPNNPNTTPVQASYHRFGLQNDANLAYRTGCRLEDIVFQRFSSNSLMPFGLQGLVIARCEGRWIGGLHRPEVSFYEGNWIDIREGCDNTIVEGCLIQDIFDAGVSPQFNLEWSPEPRKAWTTLTNITIRNNTIRRCGLAGVENVLQRPLVDRIDGVYVENNTFEECGKGPFGWGSTFGGSGCAVNSGQNGPYNGATASALTTNVHVRYNRIINCRAMHGDFKGPAQHFFYGNICTMDSVFVSGPGDVAVAMFWAPVPHAEPGPQRLRAFGNVIVGYPAAFGIGWPGGPQNAYPVEIFARYNTIINCTTAFAGGANPAITFRISNNTIHNCPTGASGWQNSSFLSQGGNRLSSVTTAGFSLLGSDQTGQAAPVFAENSFRPVIGSPLLTGGVTGFAEFNDPLQLLFSTNPATRNAYTIGTDTPGTGSPGGTVGQTSLAAGTPTNVTPTTFTLSATVSGTIPAGAVTLFQWSANPAVSWDDSHPAGSRPAATIGTFTHTFTGAPSGTTITWRAFVFTEPDTIHDQTTNLTFQTTIPAGSSDSEPPATLSAATVVAQTLVATDPSNINNLSQRGYGAHQYGATLAVGAALKHNRINNATWLPDLGVTSYCPANLGWRDRLARRYLEWLTVGHRNAPPSNHNQAVEWVCRGTWARINPTLNNGLRQWVRISEPNGTYPVGLINSGASDGISTEVRNNGRIARLSLTQVLHPWAATSTPTTELPLNEVDNPLHPVAFRNPSDEFSESRLDCFVSSWWLRVVPWNPASPLGDITTNPILAVAAADPYVNRSLQGIGVSCAEALGSSPFIQLTTSWQQLSYMTSLDISNKHTTFTDTGITNAEFLLSLPPGYQ